MIEKVMVDAGKMDWGNILILQDKINDIIDVINNSQQEEKKEWIDDGKGNTHKCSRCGKWKYKYEDPSHECTTPSKEEKKEEWDSLEGQTNYCVRCACRIGDTCTAKECVHTCGKDQPSKPSIRNDQE